MGSEEKEETQAEAHAYWQRIFAASAPIMETLQKECIARGISVDESPLILIVAMGRLSGRYAFRNMPRDEVYAMIFNEHTKEFFDGGFAEEREHES